MVSGAWGTWKDEIRSEQLLDLPLRLDEHHPATRRIIAAVDHLHGLREPSVLQLDLITDPGSREELLNELNDAVLDLFDLAAAERDLVIDFWTGRGARAGEPMTLTSARAANCEIVDTYADVFRRVWRPLLDDAMILDAQFGQDTRARVVAAVFGTQARGTGTTTTLFGDAEWSAVLDRYAIALDERTANRLLSYGELRAVTDSAIVMAADI